ncbi:hypothetical protein U1839_23840 [Sphingomonas sp. RT2P30]|uniref:hypothetical protein n=1 Tax=Parasphingomonas halimpatiens TaxID=3096162 RepID=UPI002FC8DE00
MTSDELVAYSASIAERHIATMLMVDELETAPADNESKDYKSDALAEAIFLRSFTAYEGVVERLFLHYVTGGASLSGISANSYLSIDNESHARQLTKAGYKFLSWAKPSEIRSTAQNYIERGWPLVDMMAAKEQALADCERIRNRIAHTSIEADQQFNTVQRNMLTTERLFAITPGQFLRIRSTRLRKLHIGYYIEVMTETLEALLDPRL